MKIKVPEMATLNHRTVYAGEAFVSDEFGKALIDAGFATEVKEPKAKPAPTLTQVSKTEVPKTEDDNK